VKEARSSSREHRAVRAHSLCAPRPAFSDPPRLIRRRLKTLNWKQGIRIRRPGSRGNPAAAGCASADRPFMTHTHRERERERPRAPPAKGDRQPLKPRARQTNAKVQR